MTTSDIEVHISEIYGLSVSDTTISWVNGQDPSGGVEMVATAARERIRGGFSLTQYSCPPLAPFVAGT